MTLVRRRYLPLLVVLVLLGGGATASAIELTRAGGSPSLQTSPLALPADPSCIKYLPLAEAASLLTVPTAAVRPGYHWNHDVYRTGPYADIDCVYSPVPDDGRSVEAIFWLHSDGDRTFRTILQIWSVVAPTPVAKLGVRAAEQDEIGRASLTVQLDGSGIFLLSVYTTVTDPAAGVFAEAQRIAGRLGHR